MNNANMANAHDDFLTKKYILPAIAIDIRGNGGTS